MKWTAWEPTPWTAVQHAAWAALNQSEEGTILLACGLAILTLHISLTPIVRRLTYSAYDLVMTHA